MSKILEPTDPFYFDLASMEVAWDLENTFGEEILEKEDIKDMFKSFNSDKIAFAQLIDVIKMHIYEAGEYTLDY